MVALVALMLCSALGRLAAAQDRNYETNRRLAKAIVESLQDPRFDEELLFDLKKENQVYLNRTMSLIIKYIVKREVDNYRSRRTDAISRRIYSSLIMKLIDIAKDLPRNTSAASRIDTAHRYYMAVESRDMHDKMADIQVFHVCARLYDIMYMVVPYGMDQRDVTNTGAHSASESQHCIALVPVVYKAPRILAQLGPLDDLTPKALLRHLLEMNIKPVHLGVALLIQYHLRSTVNYALQSRAIEVLETKPEAVGPKVIEVLKALAAHLLPVAELVDVHLAHSSPVFKDTCPSTWLGIVNDK